MGCLIRIITASGGSLTGGNWAAENCAADHLAAHRRDLPWTQGKLGNRQQFDYPFTARWRWFQIPATDTRATSCDWCWIAWYHNLSQVWGKKEGSSKGPSTMSSLPGNLLTFYGVWKTRLKLVAWNTARFFRSRLARTCPPREVWYLNARQGFLQEVTFIASFVKNSLEVNL